MEATRRRVPAHRTYTPELLANGRYRVEQTDEPWASIAADFSIQPYSMRRLAKRMNWIRPEQPPRDLPRAARLLAQADALARGEGGDAGQPPTSIAASSGAVAPTATAPPAAPPPVAASAAPPAVAASTAPPVADAAAIERLHQAVLEELATVEAMRAELKTLPRRPLDAERTARTISSLTDTLQKLQRLRCGLSTSGPNDDDLPADIDAFRLDLARRVDAFVESWIDPRDADGDSGPQAVDHVRR